MPSVGDSSRSETLTRRRKLTEALGARKGLSAVRRSWNEPVYRAPSGSLDSDARAWSRPARPRIGAWLRQNRASSRESRSLVMLVTRPVTVISPFLLGSAGSIDVRVTETRATGSAAAARHGISNRHSPDTATASSTRTVRTAYHLLTQSW